MHKTFLLFSLIVLVLLPSGCNLFRNGTSASLIRVTGVVFVGNDIVWLATSRGGFLKTVNRGESWQSIHDNKIANIEGLDFIDSQRGWAVNSNGEILTTSNGGHEWSLISKLDYSSEPFFGPVHKLDFVSDMHGWLVTPFAVWRTQDGGRNWDKQTPWANTADIKETIYSCHFANSQEGWLGADHGAIYATKDGGLNWQAKRIASEKLLFDRMGFIDNKNGWVSTSPSHFLYYTNDGGEAWEPQPFDSIGESYSILAIQMMSSTEGWAVGASHLQATPNTPSANRESTGVILHTLDRGNSWQPLELKTEELFFKRVHFRGDKVGWIFGQKNVYLTEDGGKNWRVALELK